MSTNALIVDVGMHRGEDAEFYLAKGFRVLAVEADPRLVAETSSRLRDPIQSGRLEIVHAAVADEPGEVYFFASDEDGWGSLDPHRGDALHIGSRRTRVRALTLDGILAGYPTPYYVKVDIEGSDASCIRALERLPEPPRFVSFECDLTDQQETHALIDLLSRLGYRRFKLVNQALNPQLRCPQPPLEGAYVDIRFSHYMSGLFGEETPGPWLSLDGVRSDYDAVASQQTARTTYTETGRLFGISAGRFHRQIRWVYNAAPVAHARSAYARHRGRHIGGWFDLHAGL
jgi:FkbM family methyltransferase